MIVYDSNPYVREVPFQNPTLPQQSSPGPMYLPACPWCCPVEGAVPNCSYQAVPSKLDWTGASDSAQARRQSYCYGLVRLGQLEKTAWPY
jgi:hypothetical protein